MSLLSRQQEMGASAHIGDMRTCRLSDLEVGACKAFLIFLLLFFFLENEKQNNQQRVWQGGVWMFEESQEGMK